MTGAALVLQGVKEYTRDIDIGCSEELFQNILKQGYQLKQLKSFEGIIIDEIIEVFRNWQAEKIVYIENIPVAEIYCIRKYKDNLGREKDLRDIELIDIYLAKMLK
ncbi:MAG: hypothetical protein K0Q65_2026 [Clostridia bacterium]|nr:hypothetical protein [Clostridia bacterium]